MSRFGLFLVAGFVLGLTLAACGGGGGSSCNKDNCGGCCDDTGKCQSGSTSAACGVDGASCGRCGAGTVCFAGTCQASTTGGGGGSSVCTSSNCGGCCDTGNVCQSGTTTSACGAGGVVCNTCGGGQVCTGGACTAGTGGGTGTGGGGGTATGGGTGTGGGNGCMQLATFSTTNPFIADYWSFTSSVGHYNVVRFAQGSTISGLDGVGIELVYPNDVVDPVPPFTNYQLTTAPYFQCKVCALFYQACDQNMVCQKNYLAQSGSVSIEEATRAEAGRIRGSASSLHFVEWDLSMDKAVSGGGCIDVTTLPSFNVGWDAGVVIP